MMMEPIIGHPGYFARIDGQILSYWTQGPFARIGPDYRVLRSSIAGRGYLKVQLKVSRNKFVTKYVHRVVCEAFHGEPKSPRNHVRHLDGNKRNNRPDNLCWGTRKENGEDIVRLGQSTKGERNAMSKLSVTQVERIRKLCAAGIPQKQIAMSFGVSQSNVSMVNTGRTWNHV